MVGGNNLFNVGQLGPIKIVFMLEFDCVSV